MTSRKPSLIVVPQQPVSRPPDPEVLPKASRRTFSAAEKLRILNAADACTQPGQIGALLRVKDCTLPIWSNGGGCVQLASSRHLPRSHAARNRWHEVC
jgi:hypothetical protein